MGDEDDELPGEGSGPVELADAVGGARRIPRRLQKKESELLKRQGLSKHHVESSLDEFVAKARGKVNDLQSFVPETRETTLAKEIDELKKKLAAAEAAIAARPAEPEPSPPPPKRGWIGMMAAFVVGAASMFVVGRMLPRSEAPTVTVAPQPVAEPAPRPIVEPIAQPSPPPPVVEPSPSPTPEVVAAQPPKPIKKPIKHPAKTEPPPPDKKPETKPQDDGLYNPFQQK